MATGRRGSGARLRAGGRRLSPGHLLAALALLVQFLLPAAHAAMLDGRVALGDAILICTPSGLKLIQPDGEDAPRPSQAAPECPVAAAAQAPTGLPSQAALPLPAITFIAATPLPAPAAAPLPAATSAPLGARAPPTTPTA